MELKPLFFPALHFAVIFSFYLPVAPHNFLMAFISFSNSEVPKVYLEGGKKRVPTVKKKKNEVDIPEDVKRVVEQIQNEEGECDDGPDEQQLQVLEDIWLKAGEIGVFHKHLALSFPIIAKFLLFRAPESPFLQ